MAPTEGTGTTSGHPKEMLAAADRILIKPLDNPRLSYGPGSGHYPSGMEGCAELITKEAAFVPYLRQFLTQMTQGLTAFQSILRQCAHLYEDGRQASVDQVNSVADQYDHSTLPDLAPELPVPAPEPAPRRVRQK